MFPPTEGFQPQSAPRASPASGPMACEDSGEPVASTLCPRAACRSHQGSQHRAQSTYPSAVPSDLVLNNALSCSDTGSVPGGATACRQG